MRVKVSYTIDMDDVPDKANEIVQAAEKILDECFARLSEARSPRQKGTKIALTQIDAVRQRLAAADEYLADAYGILGGYIQTKESLETAAQGVPPVPLPDASALDKTVEKLEALKQQINYGESKNEEL